MLTVGCLLIEAGAAIAKALAPRPAYAMSEPEIAAPLLPEDPERAHMRVVCRLFANAKTQGGMLRFSLTDGALLSVLPDEAELGAMERAQAGLLDRLFAGEFPQNHGPAIYEDIALAYARLCIILRKPPLEEGSARDLLWASAKAFSKRQLADKQLLRALRPYTADLTINPNPALRYCRAALGEIITNNL